MPIPAVATWDSAAMTASVMPSTRKAGRRLPAAVRRRAQAEGGADAPDRHADAFQVEVDDRRNRRSQHSRPSRPRCDDNWLQYQRHALKLNYHDLKATNAVYVRDRLATLKPKLLLRGLDDPTNPPEYEKEIRDAVPGSRYVKLSGAGHFSPTEIPDQVNAMIEECVAAL